MASGRNGVIEFDSFRIDLPNRLLLKNGEVVALAPKTFDLLAVLVENRGAVLDKETLFRKVWPDVFVEESSLTKNVSLLRKSLGEGPDGRLYIETIPRRGYRFQAGLAEANQSGRETARQRRAPWLWAAIAGLAVAVLLLGWALWRMASPSYSIRSIAVLPFRTEGGPEYLGHGVTEELTVRLSRIASLRVISPQVAMRYKNDPREIGRQLTV